MRYRLRTLLIVVSIVPPLIALAWLKPVYFGLLAAFSLYTFIALLALDVLGPFHQRDVK